MVNAGQTRFINLPTASCAAGGGVVVRSPGLVATTPATSGLRRSV